MKLKNIQILFLTQMESNKQNAIDQIVSLVELII